MVFDRGRDDEVGMSFGDKRETKLRQKCEMHQ